ncbi:hypothetical protein [Dokdonia sp. Hel_I_53]|uniref:hypothetical protein n=1 Tax=Dokdonia sp. Hel_I_53 TaxID=1566287 RepID=UPI0011992659|nr:hypothetical protein [Dokdonia sp. Hel_I_53]TVZ52519.1 hypothetical protein OD90_1695 [Dokdonia sp. Hel_I_53]
MIQKLIIESFRNDRYTPQQVKTSISLNWTALLFVLKNLILLAIPIVAITLSIFSDYLFLTEILSASLLISLLVFINIASKAS